MAEESSFQSGLPLISLRLGFVVKNLQRDELFDEVRSLKAEEWESWDRCLLMVMSNCRFQRHAFRRPCINLHTLVDKSGAEDIGAQGHSSLILTSQMQMFILYLYLSVCDHLPAFASRST